MNSFSASLTNQTLQQITEIVEDEIYIHVAAKVVATVTAVLTIILGCYGNGTILATRAKSGIGTAKSVQLERYMVNLALADIFVCGVVCPSYVFLLYSLDQGRAACLTWTFTLVAFGTVSLGTLDMIAMYRQGRVIWQSQRKWGAGCVICILIFLWVVGILLAIGALVQMLQSLSNFSLATSSPNECLLSTNRTILFLAPVYLASLALILTCYSKVATAVVKQSRLKKAQKHSQDPEPQTSVAKLAHDDHHPPPILKQDNDIKDEVMKVAGAELPAAQEDNQSAQVSVEKEARALLMCLFVFLTVLITWLPFVISCVIEMWQGEQFILTQIKTCAAALLCLNSALDPFVYSSLVMKRTGSTEGNNNVLDTSFGCLGWRRRQRNKLKAVVKVDVPPKQQLVPVEPENNIAKPASPEEDRRLVDVGVGPSGPFSQQVFSVYGAKKGMLISSATEYPTESLTRSNRRQSSTSLTFSRMRENSVNAEVSSICSPVKDSFTFMDFCRESSWSSHRSSRITPCDDKTSGRF